MVRIFVNGQERTRQISDWKIRKFPQKGLFLTCFFPSGKSYSRPLYECEVIPTEIHENKLLAKKDGCTFSNVERVVVYGKKYGVVQYPGNETA